MTHLEIDKEKPFPFKGLNSKIYFIRVTPVQGKKWPTMGIEKQSCRNNYSPKKNSEILSFNKNVDQPGK